MSHNSFFTVIMQSSKVVTDTIKFTNKALSLFKVYSKDTRYCPKMAKSLVEKYLFKVPKKTKSVHGGCSRLFNVEFE